MNAKQKLDEKSRPLREAVQKWAREHGAGSAGGWDHHNNTWDYAIRIVDGPTLIVKIAEDGSEARVRVRGLFGRESAAKTPLGLRNTMTRAASWTR